MTCMTWPPRCGMIPHEPRLPSPHRARRRPACRCTAPSSARCCRPSRPAAGPRRARCRARPRSAQAFGVSVGTLRHAVDELVAEHILVRRQGRGTFVATHSADRFLFQFFHVERSTACARCRRWSCCPSSAQRLDDEAAAALRCAAGEPPSRSRTGCCCRAARWCTTADAAGALFKGLTEKRLRERPGTIYQLYQSEFGITVVRAEERARAVAPTAPPRACWAWRRARRCCRCGAPR
jgi:hypothetical protein